MPHKQPQICETGCCTQEDVDCCVLAKRDDIGTYADMWLTDGPVAKGPYESYLRLYEACSGFAQDPTKLAFYTYPAMSNASKAIEFDAHACSDQLGQFACAPRTADGNSGFALCSECVTIPGQSPVVYGTFLVPDEFGPATWSCGPYDLGFNMASRGGNVEWYCVGGTYHRRLSITASYHLHFRGPAGRACYLAPDMVDGVDYTWSHHGSHSLDVQAIRSDGQAGITISTFYHWNGPRVHVTAWAYADDVDTVSLWNDPYDPLGWLTGTFSLL